MIDYLVLARLSYTSISHTHTIRTLSMKKTVRLNLFIQPRASKNEIVGKHGDAFKVRLTAPPVDGAANSELQKFLAKKLKISRSEVRIISGDTGRRKIVEFDVEDESAFWKIFNPPEVS